MFLENKEDLSATIALGSSRNLKRGVDATRENPGNCNPGWLPNDGTVILGADAGDRTTDCGTGVLAEWALLVQEDVVERASGGYIAVGCQRTQGGLHTKEYGALAKVFLNGQQVDLIGMKVVSEGHADYFHRPPVQPPSAGWPWPLLGCGTLYSWPLNPSYLVKGQAQKVALEIDPRVGWDIDYVGLLLIKTTKRLSDFGKNMFYVLLGAVLSYVIALLTLQ